MKNVFLLVLLVLTVVVVSSIGTAQISGTKTIDNTLPTGGNNYASFTDAITALNGGISGKVVFNVSAGQTFTENPPEITATGTASDSIIFRKSGGGANPKIVPLTPGTVASSTTLGSHGDAIVIVNGGDYIEFDGIDLQTDASFTTTGMMEYGYYLKKASATDAPKYITIRNCTITLNKAAIYSFGIFVSNISGTTAVTVTSTGGRSENIKLYSNTISNSYGGVQLRGFAAATPYDFYDQNIEVGADGANSITNYGGGGSTAYGVYAIYQNNCKVNNNTISGGDGTTTTQYGIFFSTSINANIDINNNTMSLTNAATTSQLAGIGLSTGATTGTTNTINVNGNNLTNFTRTAATTGVTYFIYSTSNYPLNLNISGNTISNHTLPGTGAIYGIYQLSNPVNILISNNNINNITRTGTTSTSAFYGINCDNTSSTTLTNVFGNVIHSLTGNGSTGAVGGIIMGTQTTYNTYNNKIYNITSNAGGGVVYGITVASGITTANVYNNLIGGLSAPTTSSTSDAIRGINITTTTTNSNVNISYNTVNLSASSSGTNFSTTALYHTTSATATSATLNLRNNILVNTSTPAGTGLTSSYRRSSTTLTNYGSDANYNLFFAGTPSATNVIFYDGTNTDLTLSDFKTRVAPREAGSVSQNPAFLSTTGSSADFLHIDPAVPTQIESGGISIAGITNDYDGDVRNATTPDIGADEFAGTSADLTAPTITYTALGHVLAGTVQTLSATITDASGVPTSGIGRPVAYWKINSGGSYTAATGTFISGNQYDFSFGAGTVSGDTVYYYVAAQDNFANVTVSPVAGAGGFTASPPAASTPPTSPSWYTARPAFAGGTYAVGTTLGTYPTLKAAFDAINSAIVTGNVTLSVLSEGTTETATAELKEVTYNGAYSITIKPAAAASPIITGSIPKSAIIKLTGADNVTIDGSNTAAGLAVNLTISNTSPLYSTAAVWIASLGTNAGANNITIKNCILSGGANDSNNTACIYAAGKDTITASATGAHNNNLVIENNYFQRARFGIYSRGVATTGMQTGLIIRNNFIGNGASGFEISYRGIDVGNSTAPLITGNEISNMVQPSTLSIEGIHLDANVSSAEVSRNNIYHLVASNTGGYGAYGISIGSSTGSADNLIVNNMISDLITDGDGTSTTTNPYGIRIAGGANHKVYYNTVHLSGSFLNVTTVDKSAAFLVNSSTTTGLDVRNNIFSNTMTGGVGTDCYAIYGVTGVTFATINYNDYYASGANGILGYLGADKLTLADWQTATTQDANSAAALANFVSATNPHLTGASLGDQTLKGTPLGSVTNDFDGQTRDTQAPYMGADEATPALPVQLVSFTARPNVTGNGVQLEWRTISEVNNYGFFVQRKREGELQFTELPNSFVAGHGTTNEPHDYSYVDGSLTQPGRYHYRLRQVDLDGGSNFSDVVSINVLVTGVNEAAPREFALFQNYPNPFNPETVIKFSVEHTARTTLDIYNVLGQKVATLFSDVAEAGQYYKIRFDGSGLSSGMYVYKLQSGTRSDVRKLMILK